MTNYPKKKLRKQFHHNNKKKNKILRNITKEVKDQYTKNYETLTKKIKESTGDQKATLFS